MARRQKAASAIHTARRAHFATTAYRGVAVPSGLLKPPGKSSSKVATQPFTRTATAVIANTGQKLRSVNHAPMPASPAITIQGDRTPMAFTKLYRLVVSIEVIRSPHPDFVKVQFTLIDQLLLNLG